MEKITKASQLKNIPFHDWPNSNRPKVFEDTPYYGNYVSILLGKEHIWDNTNCKKELTDEFWEVIQKIDDPRFVVEGNAVYRVYDDREKEKALIKAQARYDQNKKTLHEILNGAKPKGLITLVDICAYLEAENIQWDMYGS